MKKQILIAIAIIAFLNALAAANVSAQSGKSVKVNVEFDFQVKDKIFPAGEYYIETVNWANDNALVIKSAGKDKNRIIIVNHQFLDKAQSPKLVFERRGTNHLLKEIFLVSGQRGLSIPVLGKKNTRNTAFVPAQIVEVLLSK